MNENTSVIPFPHLSHLFLCVGPDPSARAEAARTIADPDYAPFHPQLADPSHLSEVLVPEGSLILADDPALAGDLAGLGLPTVGYLHAGNAGAKFHGVPYVISEIDNIDTDTYEKIYERVHHLPWTILTTPRCIVREMCLADLEGLYRLYDDPDTARFLEGPEPDRAREREILKAYIDRVYPLYGYGYWAVTERQSKELIGRAGFEPYQGEARDVSVGYLIRKDRRRQGLAREVVGAVLDYGRKYLDFPGMIAQTDPDNAASIGLLRSLGFRQEKPVSRNGRKLVVFRLW